MNPDPQPTGPAPIFFARTASFWWGLFPAIITMADAAIQLGTAADTSGPFAWAISAVLTALITVWNLATPWDTGWTVTAEGVQAFMRGAAPLFTVLVAWQRAGSAKRGLAARPYTIDPRAK